MSKRNISILIVLILIILLFNTYYNFKLNAVVEQYDFITLANVTHNLDAITSTYDNVEDNDQILREYFSRFNTYSWYFSQSPRLNVISLELDNMSNIIDDGISQEELKYLVSTYDEIKVFLNKINDERGKISFNRIQGAFRKSNVNELEMILDSSSL